MLDNGLLTTTLIGALGLSGIGLVYFIFIGVRALYREARQTAREAGHRRTAAAWRAVLRMIVWALYYGAFYLFVYFLGRRLGWWAVAPAAVGLAAMIWALLQADRLLTVRPNDLRQQLAIGATLSVLFAGFVSIIWLAARGG
jgi:hypothetical protein